MEPLDEVTNSKKEQSSYNTTPNRSTLKNTKRSGKNGRGSTSPSKKLLTAFSKSKRSEKTKNSSNKYFQNSKRSLGPAPPKNKKRNSKNRQNGVNSSRNLSKSSKSARFNTSLKNLTARLTGGDLTYKRAQMHNRRQNRGQSLGSSSSKQHFYLPL